MEILVTLAGSRPALTGSDAAGVKRSSTLCCQQLAWWT